MRKIEWNIFMLVAACLSYMIYMIFFVFIFKDSYNAGLILFTPLMLYSMFRLLSTRIQFQTLLLLGYISVPFGTAIFLTVNGMPGGWEVLGVMPIAVIGSFAMKADKRSTPLQTMLLTKKFGYFFIAVLFFSIFSFFRSKDIYSSLYLLQSIYSPALVLGTLMVFIYFIVGTAAVNALINTYTIFIRGGDIRRIVFIGPDFLNLSQLNLTGIVTAQFVAKDDFVKKVEMLNAVLTEKPEANTGHSTFSHHFKDGTQLTIGQLDELIKEKFDTSKIELPKNSKNVSYVALAENLEIIGYYVVDKVDSRTNTAFLKVLKDDYGVPSIIVTPTDASRWSGNAAVVATIDDAKITETDLLIIDKPFDNTRGITAGWGKATKEQCDIYLAEPHLMNVLRIVLLARRLPAKLTKTVIIGSLPFIIPLFASVFRLYIPQLSAVAALFSISLSMAYVFYSKESKK